jgi:hypothetical protein
MRSAFLCGLCVFLSAASLSEQALCKGASIETATVEQKAAAQAAFENGVAAYKTGQVRAALEAFSQSYDTVASPNAHFMIAQCTADLGDSARAWNELLGVEDEAKSNPRYAQTLDQSQKLRAELAPKVAVIEVTVEGGQATATASGQDIPLGRPFAVAPGEVDVLAFVNGKSVRSVKVTAIAGQTKPVRFDLAASAPVEGPIGPVAPTTPDEPTSDGGTPYYIAGGVFAGLAVGSAVLGAVFEARAKSNFGDTEAVCEPPTDACTKEYIATQSDNNDTYTVVKTVGWIGGGVFAGVAATMVIIGVTQGPEETSTAFEVAPGVRAKIDVAPNGAVVSGTF